jgi:hypothetical protein
LGEISLTSSDAMAADFVARKSEKWEPVDGQPPYQASGVTFLVASSSRRQAASAMADGTKKMGQFWTAGAMAPAPRRRKKTR